MRFIRGLVNLASLDTPCVATIGAFDGMHLGHQAVLSQVKHWAQQYQLPSCVVLFEPQPKEFFAQDRAAPRILPLRDKLDFLWQSGIDIVVCLRFSQRFSQMTAEAFIQQVLVAGLQIKHLIVGDDFRFGQGRKGDFALLQQAGKQHHFKVEDTVTLQQNGQRVSSSVVRQAILDGDFSQAYQLLGRAYSLLGKVQHGAKLGRELGFPTINLKLPRTMVVSGVYEVLVYGLQQWPLKGAASVGTRPAVGGGRPLLEVYLLDYDQECYGEVVRVEFVRKLRDEQNFPDLKSLKRQMAEDVKAIAFSQ